MLIDRLHADDAWLFALHWADAIAYDFTLAWRERNRRDFSFFKLILEYKGYEELMANRRSTNNGANEYNKPLWLSVDVTDDMVEQAIKASEDLADVYGSLAGLVVLGFGVSIKPDPDTNTVRCTILKTADDKPKHTLGLSANAPTPAGAVAMVLLKYFEGLDQQWVTPERGTTPLWR